MKSKVSLTELVSAAAELGDGVALILSFETFHHSQLALRGEIYSTSSIEGIGRRNDVLRRRRRRR